VLPGFFVVGITKKFKRFNILVNCL